MISFNGTTLWECGEGAGWQFTPNSVQTEVIEKQAPLGTGYWIKPRGRTKADLKLELKWLTDDVADIIGTIESINQTTLGTLTIPSPWGNYTNCRLSAIGEWNIEVASSSNRYLLAVTLGFSKYP